MVTTLEDIQVGKYPKIAVCILYIALSWQKLTAGQIERNDKVENWKDAGVISTGVSPHVRITPIPIHAVEMREGFWKPRMEANRKASLPALLKLLEENGVVDNFRLVSKRKTGVRRGPYFTDSDLYKWMEAAAWTLQSSSDPALHKLLDDVIDEVVAAQCEDGYLNTFFTGDLAEQRFRNLGDEHELYCAGHLFQAAVAHYRSTGQTKLLDAATRYADYLVRTFGPGKNENVDGHPEVEMALIELYRTTGKRPYLDLAGFFLTKQDFTHKTSVQGHAVRAGYLGCGGVDLFAETGDAATKAAVLSQWRDMGFAKVYITGGVGARGAGEAFGDPYELPNETAYSETCAAISNGMWSLRMLGLSGDAQYADMMERVLYNGFLSGVSLDGTHYFYVNPISCMRDYKREPWYGCTCCPPNVERTFASLPGYMYGISKDGAWVHLYDNSRVEWRLTSGIKFSIEQETRYPWDGKVVIKVSPAAATEFALYLRVPSWCRKAAVKVNGKSMSGVASGGYFKIQRIWEPTDLVEMDMDMPVELIESDPRVRENLGSVAIQRGPVVYCVENIDNPGIPVRDLAVAPKASLKTEFQPALLGGVETIVFKGSYLPEGTDRGPLYRPLDAYKQVKEKEALITAIPYYAWANRGLSRMVVWIPLKR